MHNNEQRNTKEATYDKGDVTGFKKHPKTWESQILKYSKITNQILFEVMENMDLLKISQSKYFQVVRYHCNSFNVIWVLRNTETNFRVNQYTEHYD